MQTQIVSANVVSIRLGQFFTDIRPDSSNRPELPDAKSYFVDTSELKA